MIGAGSHLERQRPPTSLVGGRLTNGLVERLSGLLETAWKQPAGRSAIVHLVYQQGEEAVLNREAKRNGSAPAPSRFGGPSGPDPAEAGRRGGRASGVSRKLAKQRRLEEAIFERSKNGMALYKLVEAEERRDRALEEARTRADYLVCELMDEADKVKAEIAHHRGERNRLIEERNALLAERDEIRERLESADGLAQLLAEVPEDRLTAALVSLGHEVVEEVPGAADAKT
jgi:vacuolar-type H+-ATPase subunit H